ncbi:MAG TPA: transposase [Rhodanobacteraceae bacterium]
MPHYRRAMLPGGTFFFTVVTYHRRHLFVTEQAVTHLRDAFGKIKAQRPFVIEAMVVLPDHLHCIWHLPEGDGDYSSRWREIKKLTSRAMAPASDERHERQVWQRRFWEHQIRDEEDWRRHVAYIHYNPVKHGYVKAPADWPWSSFSKFVARGWHDAAWGSAEPEAIRGLSLE